MTWFNWIWRRQLRSVSDYTVKWSATGADAGFVKVLWTILLYFSVSAWQLTLTDFIHNHCNRQANVIRGSSPKTSHLSLNLSHVLSLGFGIWCTSLPSRAQRVFAKIISRARHVTPSALSSGSGVDWELLVAVPLAHMRAEQRGLGETLVPLWACCRVSHTRV